MKGMYDLTGRIFPKVDLDIVCEKCLKPLKDVVISYSVVNYRHVLLRLEVPPCDKCKRKSKKCR